jgi:hypothetical protein
MELVKNLLTQIFLLLLDKSDSCHKKNKQKLRKNIWEVPHAEKTKGSRNSSSGPHRKNIFAKARAFTSVDPVRFGKSNCKPKVFGNEPDGISFHKNDSQFISEETLPQLFGREVRHVNNVLEDYLYISLSKIFGVSNRLIAKLVGRTSEAVRKRLAKLQKRSAEERSAIIEIAITLGQLGKNIHISTKSTKIEARRIAQPRLFKFNGRLLRFEALHELLVNFDISWFIDPNDVPICVNDLAEEVQILEGRLLLRKVTQIRTKEEDSLRHFAAKLNLARRQEKDGRGMVTGKLICEMSTAFQVSSSKLTILIEAYQHIFSGAILCGFVLSCRHL